MSADALPISLALPPFFADHHVGGRPVLSAVEAMEWLVAHTQPNFPKKSAWTLTHIRFDKFLFLDAAEPPATFARIDTLDDGSQACSLTSRFTSPGASITRTLTHATLTIDHRLPSGDPLPMDAAACLTGLTTRVDVDRVYREMVPFGTAYRNIRHLLLSPDGALAWVGSPNPPDPRSDLHLGSPYVLDAAFHAACVWCQRYGNTVGFPVAMARRRIVHPTRLDEPYTARIIPVQTDEAPFVFDIFIHDDDGRLREAVHRVQMRDVSGGRRMPPAGFYPPPADDPLAPFDGQVAGRVLVAREAITGFAGHALSAGEKRRLRPMVPTRAQGYLSARLALKRLSRQLSGPDDRRPATEIETVAEDGRSPQCPLADGSRPWCSVSHDRRFTVAVVAEHPVGVDVEPLSEKALGAPDLFMDATEQALIDASALGRSAAALRVWSVKEAAAKAARCDLADAWQRVRVREITTVASRLIMDGQALTAYHGMLADHLFTLLCMADRR